MNGVDPAVMQGALLGSGKLPQKEREPGHHLDVEGRRPELEDFLGDVLVMPAGDENYTVKADTKTGMMVRPSLVAMIAASR